MDLKNLLLPEKVVSFEFPGCDGLEFDLVFLSKERNQEILKKCQKTRYDTKTRQPYQEFDDEKFLELYVGAIIKGWKGFKLKYLKELVLADIPVEDEEEELEYTPENALDLMKNSSNFDNWVSDIISDLGKFTGSSSTQN
jgi:hypothetical protein